MKISVTINISDEVVNRVINKMNLKVEDHDFGRFRNEHHNKAVWIEDIQKGANIKGVWYKLNDIVTEYFNQNLTQTIIPA